MFSKLKQYVLKTKAGLNSNTFSVFDIKPESVYYSSIVENTHPAVYLEQYKTNNCTRILQGTYFKPSRKFFTSNNGFVHSIVLAYNHHHNIVIRPDDVWIAIATQFSFYVSGNAEKFRNKFVDFDGQRELKVAIPGCLDSAPYDQFVSIMTQEIHKNLIDDEVKDWILPNFSTTTKDDLITCGVILMATMKEYFKYTCIILCGIPSISLEGTVEDWIKLQEKLKKLRTYDLDNWVDMLEPILEQFVQAKRGKVDLSFWKKICIYDEGSGSPYLSGWITAFTVFNEKGTWQGNVFSGQQWPNISYDLVANGTVEVNVLIDDNGVEEKAVMFSGHLAAEVLQDECTIQPRSGWAIALKSKENSEC